MADKLPGLTGLEEHQLRQRLDLSYDTCRVLATLDHARTVWQRMLGKADDKLEEVQEKLQRAEALLGEARDVLRGSAPQSWAAGTNLYEHAVRWEREACEIIGRIDTAIGVDEAPLALPAPPEPVRKAAVSAVVRDGCVLCVWNARYEGWGLPGGLVEDNETPEQAQARELSAETGMRNVSPPVLVFEGPHGLPHKPGRASVVCLYLVEATGEPSEMEPGCPTAWMTVEDFLTQSPFRRLYIRILPALVAAVHIAQRLRARASEIRAASDERHATDELDDAAYAIERGDWRLK